MLTPQPDPSPPPPDFQITTTLRYDPALTHTPFLPPSPNPAYYLLPHHLTRLLASATAFNWPAAIALLSQPRPQALTLLTTHCAKHIPDPSRPYRLRILLAATGEITVEATPLPPPSLAPAHTPLLLLPAEHASFDSLDHCQQQTPWNIYLDTQPTPPTLFTTHKTTARAAYAAARARAGIDVNTGSPQQDTSPREVLLYNPAGEVMEGSVTTVYFRRGGRWVTPKAGCGGNVGTSRRYALESGVCVEGTVRVGELVGGERVWLSNGVRGFVPGVLRLGGDCKV
ncbi:hypothetical protein FQN50_004110 [Emmonsiellopsis sp. PD_5]|nr:hypothetical protein FQN50_004110 [Emmonsiellopsis sp. PD_5]